MTRGATSTLLLVVDCCQHATCPVCRTALNSATTTTTRMPLSLVTTSGLHTDADMSYVGRSVGHSDVPFGLSDTHSASTDPRPARRLRRSPTVRRTSDADTAGVSRRGTRRQRTCCISFASRCHGNETRSLPSVAADSRETSADGTTGLPLGRDDGSALPGSAQPTVSCDSDSQVNVAVSAAGSSRRHLHCPRTSANSCAGGDKRRASAKCDVTGRGCGTADRRPPDITGHVDQPPSITDACAQRLKPAADWAGTQRRHTNDSQ